MADLCLTLFCPPVLEEKLLDMLLIAPEVVLFASTRASVHGMPANQMSQAEQVLGCSLATQIQVLFSESDKVALFNRLQQFSGTGLRYWVMPVLESGELA